MAEVTLSSFWRTIGSTRDAKSTSQTQRPARCTRLSQSPANRKRQLVTDADHAIVVILDFSFEALSAIELKRIERLDHRRSLVAHIRRGRVFHPRLRHGARTHRMLQMVEAQLFTYVELDQDQNKSTQTRRARTRNCSRHLTPASYCILSVTAPGAQLLVSSGGLGNLGEI